MHKKSAGLNKTHILDEFQKSCVKQEEALRLIEDKRRELKISHEKVGLKALLKSNGYQPYLKDIDLTKTHINYINFDGVRFEHVKVHSTVGDNFIKTHPGTYRPGRKEEEKNSHKARNPLSDYVNNPKQNHPSNKTKLLDNKKDNIVDAKKASDIKTPKNRY
jgi:hypothetical protein